MSLYRRYRPLLNLIGLALLIALIIFFKIDLRQTLAYVTHANALDLALAVFFFIPFLLVKAWRWQIILRDLDTTISLSTAVKLYALGLGAGMVTPGQVGDAVKIAYFRARGMGRALVSVLLDRLWDVLILLLLAGSGAFLFWREFESEWFALALLLAGTVTLLAITTNPRAQMRLLTFIQRVRGANAERSAFEPIRLNRIQILRQFALTVLATVIVYLRLYFLISALDIHLDAIPFIAAMSLASVAALLPISVSGVGTRDATLLFIAPIIGITREQALGMSALILFLSVINGLVGFGVWIISAPERRSENQ